MILSFGSRKDAYLYSDAADSDATKAILTYRFGEQPERVIEDDSYPFEFSIPWAESGGSLRSSMSWVIPDGETRKLTLPDLEIRSGKP